MNGPIDRSLIEAARPALGPKPGRTDALRQRVLAATVAGAAASAATTASAAGAAGGTASLGAKLLIGLFGISMVAAGVAVSLGGPSDPSVERAPAVPAAPADTASGASREAHAAPSLGAEIAVPPEAVVAVAEPIVAPMPSEPVAEPIVELATEHRSTAARPSRPAVRDEHDPLDDEAELLAAASRAARTGEPEAALRLLSVHEDRFPRGELREERIALEARVLCAQGRTADGRALGDLLARRFPRSLHLASVARACTEPADP